MHIVLVFLLLLFLSQQSLAQLSGFLSDTLGPGQYSVGDLTIAIKGADAALCWSPVFTTVHGNPVEVDAYLVYHSETAEGPFLFHGLATDTCYTHGHVFQFNDAMFYEVTAYVGSIELLLIMSLH